MPAGTHSTASHFQLGDALERVPARPAQRGVALVVTLLMLSIITVVTVAFLALSQRERTAVGQATMQTTAEMAAETGRERAIAQVMARILNTNAYQSLLGPGLLVSLAESNSLNNLLLDPWVPVYVTNRSAPLGEDRSYLDLNRNRQFDPSGYLPLVNEFGSVIPDPSGSSGGAWINKFTGDPMWIGVLENPDQPHSAANRFIARYCFIAVPAGQTLDLNYVHNSVLNNNLANDIVGYHRNQGFGTWEMNLAGFFTDLNTNLWSGYYYNPDPLGSSSGLGFADALNILKYRYTPLGQTNPFAPRSASAVLTNLLLYPSFGTDYIDSLGNNPPVSLGRYYTTDPDTWPNAANLPWAGSGDRRHFYSIHDFFTLGQRDLLGFSSRMDDASTNRASYDRYTFYRMLEQISTDSANEEKSPDQGKINLNYANIRTNNLGELEVVAGLGTNFQAWAASNFFLITADRLLTNEFQRHHPTDLRYNTNIGLLNGRRIPVYLGGSPNTFTNVPAGPTNPPLYAPRIHQLLQVAANIYEATQREKANEVYPFYPTVFHPVFAQDGSDIYLTGYEEIDPVRNPGTHKAADIFARQWHDLNDGSVVTLSTVTNCNDNIYGIPMIVAAKKGFPNFNEAAISTAVKVSRRIQFKKRTAADTRPYITNIMFTVGISNVIGVEAWNSYSNGSAYPRDLSMTFACRTETRLTNNGTLTATSVRASNSVMAVPKFSWTGGEFQVPAQIYDVAITNSVLSAAGTLLPIPPGAPVFFPYRPGITNRLQMRLKNKLLFYLEETEPGPNRGRLIDAVALSGMDSDIDITAELAKSESAQYWRLDGEREQISDARAGGSAMTGWNGYSGLQLGPGEVAMTGQRLTDYLTTGDDDPNAPTDIQVGFTPTERLGQLTKWSVNDPLVHYTLADLQPKGTNESQALPLNLKRDYSISLTNNGELGPLGKINKNAYHPWGTGTSGSGDNPALKDPGVRSSDDWEFPEQKLPNVGWLGRIHRGTPWQTIYLKSGDASTDWLYPAGSAWTMTTHPTNDWRLVDFFTTAPNDIAARGRLSINQTNLAAWSAVFSGIGVARLVESNTPLGSVAVPVDDIFQPASAYNVADPANAPALVKVVNGINARRAQMPNGMFRTLGEFLSTPELTSASPFLDLPYTSQWCKDRLFTEESVLTDFEMERLPAQMLGLVTVGEPRYVIYAWGQALQPAPYGVEYDSATGFMKADGQGRPIITPNSIITTTSGNLFKFCGNYQVTAEVATRAVLRIEVDPASLDPNGPNGFVRPRAVIESFNILPNE